MTNIRRNTSDPLSLMSRAAASAHKDGYQVAVLAVKQEDQGSKFTFKYEGVEGKPCKLLEQLFKEIISGFGGTCSGGVCESSGEKCTNITRSDNDDKDKLQFLLDIASLIDSTRSKVSHTGSDPVSGDQTESLNCNVDDFGEIATNNPLSLDHSMSTDPGDQLVMNEQPGLIGVTDNEPGDHFGYYDFSIIENNTPNLSQKDIIQGETTLSKSSSQSNFSAIIDQIGSVTAVVMTQPPNVKIEPVDMELSVPHHVSGVSGFSDVTSRSGLSEDQHYFTRTEDVVAVGSSSSTLKAAVGGTSSLRLAKRRANQTQHERVKHHPLFSTVGGTGLGQKSQYGASKYKTSKCPHCSFSNRQDRMRRHIIRAHYPQELEKVTRNIRGRDNNGMFYCPRCSYSSDKLGNLQGHIISHHIPKRFPVPATVNQISMNLSADHQDVIGDVNKSTPGFSNSHTELEAAANSPRLAQPKNICEKGKQNPLPSTARTSELDKHSAKMAPRFRVGQNKLSKCPHCTFSNRRDRVRHHIILAHFPREFKKITCDIKGRSNDGNFNCPRCQYSSNLLANLHRHIINHHIPKQCLPT